MSITLPTNTEAVSRGDPQELEFIASSHKNDDGDREVGNRLLVAQTLVGRDKHIELVRGAGKKCPILLGSPAHFWNGANLVVR